ncbi:MAG: hypothetical protein J0H68_05180 [Sphingobacteriia bacterium]|nr:hypothetical protein [Sphingobacteriia bacterium]
MNKFLKPSSLIIEEFKSLVINYYKTEGMKGKELAQLVNSLVAQFEKDKSKYKF